MIVICTTLLLCYFYSFIKFIGLGCHGAVTTTAVPYILSRVLDSSDGIVILLLLFTPFSLSFSLSSHREQEQERERTTGWRQE